MVDEGFLQEVEIAFLRLRLREERMGPETGGIRTSDDTLWEIAKRCVVHRRLVAFAAEKAKREGRDFVEVYDEELANQKAAHQN